MSDHVADQSKLAAKKRETDFRIARENFSVMLATHKEQANSLHEKTLTAFRSGHYFAWLISFLPRIWHALSFKPKRPTLAAPSREEIVWNAGGEGEKRFSDALSGFLSDDWTLISGYRNKGGEIDKLLVGPLGVMAIEIKFINGKVSCDGDKWWRDKYDRYGNLVESGVPISDKRGRGPSAQVNAAANRLQSFLSKRSLVPSIARAVVLTHDSSEIGRVSNQTVNLISTLAHLNMRTITASMRGGLGDTASNRVIELIRKDHEFNNQSRSAQIGGNDE